MNATTNLPLHLRRPVSIRPVSAQGWQQMSGDRRATHASVLANYHYITRSRGEDARGTIDYRHRDDLVGHGLALPRNHPLWATEPGRLWREADAATGNLPADAIRAWHVVVSLQADLEPMDWLAMVNDYAESSIAAHGPAVAWAIHAQRHPDGTWHIPPHAHLLMTTRAWRHDAGHGKTVPAWCGAAMRGRLHEAWLANLPADMRAAATSAFSVGSAAPARLDCSALEDLFGNPPLRRSKLAAQRIRARSSRKLKRKEKRLSEERGK